MLLDGVSFEVGYGERVAIVGPNGAGKTTLLRLIEGRLEPLAGRIRLGAGVRLGVLAQEHETLDPQRSLLDTVLRARPMSETDARSFLHLFLFGGDSVFKPVGACSLGERSRRCARRCMTRLPTICSRRGDPKVNVLRLLAVLDPFALRYLVTGPID